MRVSLIQSSTILSNLFGTKTVKALGSWAEMKSLGEITVDSGDSIKVGTTMRGKALYCYGERSKMATTGRYPITNDESKYYCYMTNAVLGSDAAGAALASWILGSGGSNVGFGPGDVRLIRNSDQYIDFHIDPASITSSDGFFDFKDLDASSNYLIPMRCSHAGEGLHAANWSYFDGNGAVTTGDVALRVVAKGEDGDQKYAVIALMTQKFAMQTGLGLFRVDYTPKGVELRINKNSGSSLNGLCSDNPRYDFRGAIFGVYRTLKAAQEANLIDSTDDESRDNMGKVNKDSKNYFEGNGQLLGCLETKNAVGMTGVLDLEFAYKQSGELKDAFKGGVYIRELQSPYGFDLSPEIVELTLPKNAQTTKKNLLTVTMKDPPIFDPGGANMVKVPEGAIGDGMSTAEYMEALKANPESMNGAIFELRYYKVWANPEKYPLEKGEEDACWTLKTIQIDDINGRLNLNLDECWVSGKNRPPMIGGERAMPLDLYVLDEIEAPPGLSIKKNKMKCVANVHRVSTTVARNGWKQGENHFMSSLRGRSGLNGLNRHCC